MKIQSAEHQKEKERGRNQLNIETGDWFTASSFGINNITPISVTLFYYQEKMKILKQQKRMR